MSDRTPTALITGASRGLGLTLAEFLAAQGYALVIDARNETELRAAAERLATVTQASSSKVKAIAGDVTHPAHRRALTRAVGDRLDLLVNNASALGATLGATPLPPLADTPLPNYRVLLETNVVAPLALLQATLPALRAARGLVVNLSSDAAVGGYPGWGAYGSSKAALDLLSRTLAAELSEDGVSVVSVDPGDMRTRMQQQAFPGEDIGDRPPPEVTLPFWAWLLGQPREAVNGRRFEAQADSWELAPQADAAATGQPA